MFTYKKVFLSLLCIMTFANTVVFAEPISSSDEERLVRIYKRQDAQESREFWETARIAVGVVLCVGFMTPVVYTMWKDMINGKQSNVNTRVNMNL